MSIGYRPGDAIRLTRSIAGTPEGSEGVFIGWYTNEPHLVLVRLWDGGVQRVPRDAIVPAEMGRSPGSWR